MALGDLQVTCCDVVELGVQADCAETSDSNRQRRATNSQVQGENRPLDGESNYTYYMLSATPSDNGPLYAASDRSAPFSSVIRKFIFKPYFHQCSVYKNDNNIIVVVQKKRKIPCLH